MQTGGVVYLEGELRRDSRALDPMHLRVLVPRERPWLGREGIALGRGRLTVAVDTHALPPALPPVRISYGKLVSVPVPSMCAHG